MELYQIKSFLEVARLRNLTRAAALLHISPSALSTQIKSLEASLEVTLFHRSARGMYLTPAGQDLLPRARKLIKEASTLKKRAAELGIKPPDMLRIGMNADPDFLKMSRLNEALAEALPDVTIRYVGSSTLETARMLRKKQIDIGFMYGERIPPDMQMDLLALVKYQVVIPRSLSTSPEDLDLTAALGLPWIWGHKHCPSHVAFQEQINPSNLDINTVSFTVDEKITKQLIRDAKGVALVREDEARALSEFGQADIWKPGSVRISFGLAYLTGRKKTFPAQTARNIIKDLWNPPSTLSHQR